MADAAADRPLLWLALHCRCPRCGEGPLYDGVLTVRSACAICGLDLSNEDAGDGAAVFVIFLLGAVVVGLGFAADQILAPPLWVHAVVWIPFTTAGAIFMLRPIKAALIVQQYRVRSLDLAEPPG